MPDTRVTNTITGRDAFMRVLQDEGVSKMFGNPGTTELPIMHALSSAPEMGYVLGLQEAVVIAKGAHTPYCTPRAIGTQLAISLDRLQRDHVPIYILHRDNPDVPVGEFIDALNDLQKQGKIGIFGGSNWSPARFAAANAYAAAQGLHPMRLLNNNLSLATMVQPVWAGCITSNTPETLAYLRQTSTAHLSWSSQARGYFLPEPLRNRLPADTAPETCFGGPANATRRSRAETLAAARGVSAHNIATAWVLAQSFPSLALIGPRSPGELASTLPNVRTTTLEGSEHGMRLVEAQADAVLEVVGQAVEEAGGP